MNTWVTSDQHFNHANIIRLARRPFESVEMMNDVMIQNWNALVKFNDTVIFNGDFTWSDDESKIFNSLNGKKVLIKGNHDPLSTTDLRWTAVHDMLEFKHYHKKIVMCHYPILSWNGMFKGSIHLHGHTHSHLKNETPDVPRRVNICVEAWNYKPINLDEIIETYGRNSNA